MSFTRSTSGALVLALALASCSRGGGHDAAVDPHPGTTATTVRERFVAVPDPGTGGRAVAAAPGEPHEVLALAGVPEPEAARARSLAYWWIWSDPQLIDEELPARTGFFDARTVFDALFDAGFRPQEDLSLHLLNATILTANEVMRDYGRPFDMALGLGDCADNAAEVEVDWLVEIFDGLASPGAPAGHVRPDTGDLDLAGGFNRGARDFGTQEAFDPFTRPGLPNSNADFPVEGLRRPDGAPTPWYSVVGNHDALNVGNFPVDGSPIDDPVFGNFLFEGADYTGDIAPFGYLLGLPNLIFDSIANQGPPAAFYDLLGGPDLGALFSNPVVMALLLAFASDGEEAVRAETDPNFSFAQILPTPFDPARDRIGIPTVPDPRRAFAGTEGFIDALRARGHGFELAPDGCEGAFPGGVNPDRGYFAMDAVTASGAASPIRLIFLNTSEYPVIAEGGITRIQWEWLDCQLARATAEDRLIVVLAHHRSDALNRIVDTEAPGRPALCDAPETCSAMMVERLHAYPNVFLHLVGHGHENLVIAREGSTPEAGYWEVETSAIIDWPQQTRIVEVVAYPNGVGELWSTMLDHASLSADPDANVLSELARVLGASDAVEQPSGTIGGENGPDDRNRVLRFVIPAAVREKIATGDGRITSRDRFPASD